MIAIMDLKISGEGRFEMTNVRVALLDTGVDGYIVDNRIKLRKQIYYDYYDEQIVISDDCEDYNGHGTLCMNTMWQVTPNVDIFSINMLGISGTSSNRVFLEALKYVEKLDVDIISICSSCTVLTFQDEIREICKRIHDSGKVIIAAVENGKDKSKIADYKNVIGVIGADLDGYMYTFSETWDIQMCCDSRPFILDGHFMLKEDFMGNSRATAIATGIVAKLILENSDSSKDIIQLLKENRISNRENEYRAISDLSNEIEFDIERENYLFETDKGYFRFIYLMCEAFLCEDPEIMRTANLFEYKSGEILYKMNSLVRLIENRFCVKLDYFCFDDFKWAYLFYEKNILKK